MRCILGEDALLGADNFHAVTTDFFPGFLFANGNLTDKLTDTNGDPIVPVYIKRLPRITSDGLRFSVVTIKNPLSGGGARALSHFVTLMHGNSKEPISRSLDYDLLQRPDISFISFGGPLSNYKTDHALSDPANNLIKFEEAADQGYFEDPEAEPRIAEPGADFDHGLILKFYPKDRPERTWLVCAGFDEPGTSGAAWYLANKWKKIYRDVKKDPFAIVVQVNREQGDESAYPVWGKVHTRKGVKYLYQEQTSD
ncbi:hypothetical protein ACFL6S_26655 [Candidatus Poribacteria bacterium]